MDATLFSYSSICSTLTLAADLTPLNILVHVGNQGFNYENNLAWMAHLKSQGIEHQKIIVPDVGHSAMEIYQKRGLDIMRFHEKNFGVEIE